MVTAFQLHPYVLIVPNTYALERDERPRERFILLKRLFQLRALMPPLRIKQFFSKNLPTGSEITMLFNSSMRSK